ncbi:MAG: DUF167 domain-containing protein [Propionivibrio sp.]
MAAWLRVDQAGKLPLATLTLHLQPGAKNTEIVGLHGDALKIRLTALPVDGKANAALIAFIAARLGVAKSAVELLSGHASRRKLLVVSGAPPDSEARLTPTPARNTD